MSIPKYLHFIWIQGEENMNERDRNNIQNIRNLNPNWICKVWNDDNLISLLQSFPDLLNVYNNVDLLEHTNINPLATKSDIGRRVILYQYGGVYMDVDVECVDNLDNIVNKILPQYDIAVSSLHFLNRYGDSFIASIPSSPIWLLVFDNVLKAKSRKEVGDSFGLVVRTSSNKFFIFNETDVSFMHCGTASKCMIPIRAEATMKHFQRILLLFWCRHKKIITVVLILLLIFYVIRTNLKYKNCKKTQTNLVCDL